MPTALLFGPADHGRRVAPEEIQAARWQEGFRYEIIDGRLYVSPLPNLPQNSVEEWLNDLLRVYRLRHPEVINYVTNKARVFVPGREDLTVPEPDLAAYRDFPLRLPLAERRWELVSPVLVIEVLSEDNPGKDLVRNVELYLQVPSIREYWIIDPREDADRPTMRVYRRRGQRWQQPIELAFGDTYTTRLLPGFSLRVDPHWFPATRGNGR
jgi:Uma2 family endonuclease